MPTLFLELEITFEGDYTPGGPATPPSFSSGGDPPYGPEFAATRVTSVTYSRRVWDRERGAPAARDFPLNLLASTADSFLLVLNDEPLAEEVCDLLRDEQP